MSTGVPRRAACLCSRWRWCPSRRPAKHPQPKSMPKQRLGVLRRSGGILTERVSCTKSMRTAREFPRFSLLWTVFRGLCRFAPLALPHGPTADGPTARQPHQVVRRLPTPRMVQCTSGARASAVLLLAQAKALKQTRPLEGVADVEYPASTSLLQNQQSSGKGAWLQHFASEHVMV